MLSLNQYGYVHIPNHPNKFEFDEEVSESFDDMAVRSIPLYDDSRLATARIAAAHVERRRDQGRKTRVLDIGTSTGAFYGSFWPLIAPTIRTPLDDVHGVALDTSTPMIRRVQSRYPQIESKVLTIEEYAESGQEPFDIINIAYVVQFIPKEDRMSFWDAVSSMANSGALIFVSTKEKVPGAVGEAFDNLYIEFRKANGYSTYEIEAKTRALKNSMWPEPIGDTLTDMYNADIMHKQEISRWLHFVTFMAIKV